MAWSVEYAGRTVSFFGSVLRSLLILILCSAGASVLGAQSSPLPARHIVVAIDNTSGPVDRFFDLSVGSDYPGTLMRDDSQAQLKVAVDELGFRYIRFHAIFHDVLGTVRAENGKTEYNWSGIDRLYDDLLARHIKPFVELGFTPNHLATSQNSIFYCMAILAPRSRRLAQTLWVPSSAILSSASAKTKCAPGTLRFGTNRTSPAFGRARIRKHTLTYTI